MRLALMVSFLLAAGACLLFFFSFEKRKPSVKDILPVVVMVAVASAGRVLFNFLPQIQPVTAIVMIMGIYCGGLSHRRDECFGLQSVFGPGAVDAFPDAGVGLDRRVSRRFGKGAGFPQNWGGMRLRLFGRIPLWADHRSVDPDGHGGKPELDFGSHGIRRRGSV